MPSPGGSSLRSRQGLHHTRLTLYHLSYRGSPYSVGPYANNGFLVFPVVGFSGVPRVPWLPQAKFTALREPGQLDGS